MTQFSTQASSATSGTETPEPSAEPHDNASSAGVQCRAKNLVAISPVFCQQLVACSGAPELDASLEEAVSHEFGFSVSLADSTNRLKRDNDECGALSTPCTKRDCNTTDRLSWGGMFGVGGGGEASAVEATGSSPPAVPDSVTRPPLLPADSPSKTSQSSAAAAPETAARRCRRSTSDDDYHPSTSEDNDALHAKSVPHWRSTQSREASPSTDESQVDREYSKGELEVEWTSQSYCTRTLSAWYSYHTKGAGETNNYGVNGVHDALMAKGDVFSYHSSTVNLDEVSERIALIETETGKKVSLPLAGGWAAFKRSHSQTPFDPSESVESLKSKLSQILGFPPERQHLFTGEKELVSKPLPAESYKS